MNEKTDKLPDFEKALEELESLVEQPALMSFFELSSEERLEVGIAENLVRLSLGIEDVRDLIKDLDQALNQI